MNKDQLLNELSLKINSGEISYDEMMHRFNLTTISKEVNIETNVKKSIMQDFSITKALYSLGIVIVLVGIAFFTNQIWGDIGSFERVAITLGLGLLTTVIGVFLQKTKPEEVISTIFYLIGGMLVPGGSLVTLKELSTGRIELWPLAITFGIIFAFYLLLNFAQRKVILTFFTIVNGTAFIYLLIRAMDVSSSYSDIYVYMTMIIGVSYILLAQSFKDTSNQRLIELLNFFGSAGLLGVTFYKIFNSIPWQFIFFFMVIGGFILSIYVISRSILLVSTLFLIAYISYITIEYFADSVGWPISLIVLGFIFIGLGYMSIAINKKYIVS